MSFAREIILFTSQRCCSIFKKGIKRWAVVKPLCLSFTANLFKTIFLSLFLNLSFSVYSLVFYLNVDVLIKAALV